MRAIQIAELTGPDSALRYVELPEPEPSHPLAPAGEEAVVVEVHAAGVSFPEVLQTRGEYQFRPPLPFVPGSEVGGVVRSAPASSGLAPGDRVAAFTALGAFAETAVAPAFFTFKLPDTLDFAHGASLVLNYHTAYFALRTRGRLREGETVLVHGETGRVVVVGFTGGSIPEVRVNRLLLGNTEVIGAGWGAYAMPKPDVNREVGAAIDRLIERGYVRPLVGAHFDWENASGALRCIDGRQATGKVVLDVRAG